jgi:hypothetical protein
MDFFKWLSTIVSGLITACLGEEYLKFRPGLPEKYVLKDDFIRVMKENREDHSRMFTMLDEVLKELGRKEDRK